MYRCRAYCPCSKTPKTCSLNVNLRRTTHNKEAQRRFNENIDLSQNTLETIVDTQQKAADVYFKNKLRTLEFKAGKLIEIFRD